MPTPSVISWLTEKQKSCFSINYAYMLTSLISLKQGNAKNLEILMNRLI